MGAWLARQLPDPPEKRDVVHTIHLRAPMTELNYTEIAHKDNGFYPLQAVFSIDRGHADWDGFINHIIDSCQVDRSKVVDYYWVVWVTKFRPSFSEEQGEYYTTVDRIVNQSTPSQILAMYILDPDCEFYVSLDRNAQSGIMRNSIAVNQSDQLLRPSDRF